MSRRKSLATLLFILCCYPRPAFCFQAEFNARRAFQILEQLVSLGPRHPGSLAHQKTQQLIEEGLQTGGFQVERDRFQASTPLGTMEFVNLIGKLHIRQGLPVVVLSGHYDTKRLPGIPFLGANDGGSSTAFLLEMARALAAKRTKLRVNIYLVFFDGEEAFARWSRTDGLYGSRHLAKRWASDGTLSRIRALINVDMIADRELKITREYFSTGWLQDLIWKTARELGYERHFSDHIIAVEDDHLPFVEKGVSAVNLIDFEYGPMNTFWHTGEDTIDKLSPDSLNVVAQVLLATLEKLASPSGAAVTERLR